MNQDITMTSTMITRLKFEDINDLSCLDNLKFHWIYTNKKYKYCSVPCAFDIETSSFSERSEKRAIMYSWCFGIGDYTWRGRTWDSFLDFISRVCDKLGINEFRRLYIGVHNLSYEFQFICKWFEWIKVFAVDTRKPVYACTTTGLEFHCTFIMSGYALAKLGTTLHKYKCEKMVGDLDYSKIRNSLTPLTEKELGYIYYDVRVVICWLMEQIEEFGDLSKIPITKTGVVRNHCRNACFYEENEPHKNSKKKARYSAMIHTMRLSVREYEQCKRAFAGGFNHANALYVGKVVNNVGSDDLTSAYPTQLVGELFPMSSPEHITLKDSSDFYDNMKKYCCIFDVEFTKIEATFLFENYISKSHCWVAENVLENNGRVVEADKICLTITEVDYDIIKRTYTWEKMRVKNFMRFRRGYLPKDLILSILYFYNDKTKLKGVPFREYDLLKSKEKLNASYGMTVTDPCREENIFNGESWSTTPINKEKTIEKYNSSASRFLYYPWGVYCTAYCRRTLWSAILEYGADYVYSDTDSVKGINHDKHVDFINKYNAFIVRKLERAMDYHGLPHDLIKPKNIKGIEKPLGVFDFEGTYTRFKTLGCKRYLTECEDGYIFIRDGKKENYPFSITVSGLNKTVTVPYLFRTFGKNVSRETLGDVEKFTGVIDEVFEVFNDDLYIPPHATGKNTHTYIDEEIKGTVVDYLGNSASYYEKSFIHLEECEYSMSIADKFKEYLERVNEREDSE